MDIQFKAEAIEDTPGYFIPVVRLICTEKGEEYPISECIIWMGLGSSKTEKLAEQDAAAYIMDSFAKMLNPTRVVRL